MPLLNTADALYLGANAVDRVYLGATQVWPTGAPDVGTVGDTGANGGGNWPTSADRGVFAPFVLAHTATLTAFNMRTRAPSSAGNRYKGVMYAADGASGRPGTLLAVTAASAAIGAGVQLITIPAGGEVIAPQTVWIGYVCDGAAGSGAETDSGGVNAAQTIMMNGIISFASPQDPASAWPGSPGPYSNVPAAWFDYEY